MNDLFEKEINDAIKAVPLNKAWAETLHKLLKAKRRLSNPTKRK